MVDLAARRIMKQATFMPPRHGKSEFRTVYFPAWYLGTFPEHRVVLACHTSDLAEEFGGRVRDILEEWGQELFGVQIRQDSRSKTDWKLLGHRGGMRSIGIGGGITGYGYELGLIDDPIKDAEEARSPATQARNWRWYTSTFRSRQEPGAIMAITETPWHTLDLGMRIIEAEPEKWDILRLPAFAEEDDPIGRKEGEVLWPQRYDRDFLEAERELSPESFSSLYQCTPIDDVGGMFQEKWFDGQYTTRPPAMKQRVRFWDKAATHNGGDYTVGLLMGKGVDDRFYIMDVVRGRWSEHERNRVILATAEKDGENVLIRGEQEPGAAGKDAAAAFARLLVGYHVQSQVASGSKEVRAQPFADQCQPGNVVLVRGQWDAKAYIKELTSFPNGKHDDQVDASSGAFNRLMDAKEVGKPAWGGSRSLVLRTPGQFGRHPSFGRFGRIGRTG
jgi:predicted phage terminase large subunit-like protein